MKRLVWIDDEKQLVVPLYPTNKMVVAIENRVEQQLTASAMNHAHMFRLDGSAIYEDALMAATAIPDAQAVKDERAAFEEIFEAVESLRATLGVISAKSEFDTDVHFHEKWAMDELQSKIEQARAALSAAVAGGQKRCQYCDGTGDVHDQTGEWRGECTECDANDALNAKRLRVLMRRSLVIPAFIRIADGIIGAEAREAAIAAASKGE